MALRSLCSGGRGFVVFGFNRHRRRRIVISRTTRDCSKHRTDYGNEAGHALPDSNVLNNRSRTCFKLNTQSLKARGSIVSQHSHLTPLLVNNRPGGTYTCKPVKHVGDISASVGAVFLKYEANLESFTGRRSPTES